MPVDQDVATPFEPPNVVYDVSGLPRIDSYEHVWGICRVGAIPNYAAAGSVTATEASADVAASNLLEPEDDAAWQSAGVSDQVDKIRLDLPAAPWVTCVALQAHNLTIDGTLQLRGFPAAVDPADHADMVVKPFLIVAASAGVSGVLGDVDNGVDAWTDPGLTIPAGGDVRLRFSSPAATPHLGAAAGLVRLRIRLAAAGPAAAVALTIELRQGASVITPYTGDFLARAEELGAVDAGGIVMLAFDPGELPTPETPVDVFVRNDSGPSIVLREIDVAFEPELPAGVYRSTWRPALPKTHSDLEAVLRAHGGFVAPPTYTWWLSTADNFEALGQTEPDVDLATPRLAWEIRIRDGANPAGYLEARGLLAGATFVAGLASAAKLGRRRPVAVQTLLSGASRRLAVGPTRRTLSVSLSRPLPTGIREVFEGVAANRGAVVVGLWPANTVTDDATTMVAVVAEDEIGHEVTRGHPQKLNTDLRFEEV